MRPSGFLLKQRRGWLVRKVSLCLALGTFYFGASCTPPSAANNQAFHGTDSTRAVSGTADQAPVTSGQWLVRDFDSDGRLDTARSYWVDSAGISRPAITIELLGASPTVILAGDVLLDILDSRDLNGDGYQDLLVEVADESSRWFGVITVERDSLHLATPVDPTEVTLVWANGPGSMECADSLRPKFHATEPRIFAFGGRADGSPPCAGARPVVLELRSDHLEHLPEESPFHRRGVRDSF